jgi:hypothetical protein
MIFPCLLACESMNARSGINWKTNGQDFHLEFAAWT